MKIQKEQILSHLIKKNSITSWEAIEKYGITRLADRIFNLKNDGYNIITVIERKDNKKWARYVYMGVNK